MSNVVHNFAQKKQEEGWLGTWATLFSNIFKTKELVWLFFKRDFFSRYKKSMVGIVWIIIAPIVGILSWVFLNSVGVLNPGDMEVPFPIYVLIGSSVWGVFISFFEGAKATLTSGKDLMLQVNYPHEAMLFKQGLLSYVNFLIYLILNICFISLLGHPPSIYVIFTPFVLFPLFLLGAGLGLFVSILSALTVDFEKAVSMVLKLMIYSVPIIYVSSVNPHLKLINEWNPLTYLICSVRDIILFGRFYNLEGYLVSSLGAIVLFLISIRIFYSFERRVVERII